MRPSPCTSGSWLTADGCSGTTIPTRSAPAAILHGPISRRAVSMRPSPCTSGSWLTASGCTETTIPTRSAPAAILHGPISRRAVSMRPSPCTSGSWLTASGCTETTIPTRSAPAAILHGPISRRAVSMRPSPCTSGSWLTASGCSERMIRVPKPRTGTWTLPDACCCPLAYDVDLVEYKFWTCVRLAQPSWRFSIGQEPGLSLFTEWGPPRRVLLVIDSLRGGGAERYVADLAIALRSRGWDVEVACSASGVRAARLHASDIPVNVLVGSLVEQRLSLRYVLALRRLVARGRYDVVHAHLYASAAA